MVFKLFKQYKEILRKAPARGLTYAYVVALGLIAVLTIAGHGMTAHISYKQQEGGEIAYHLSRQRGLVQDISMRSRTYTQTLTSLDKDFLNHAIRELASSHDVLIRMVKSRKVRAGVSGGNMYKIYVGEPYMLDSQMVSFVAAANQILTLTTDQETRLHREAVLSVIERSGALLTSTLDMTLENYQAEALEETRRYAEMQMWSAVFILMVLLLEALYIFRPLARGIEQYQQLLIRHAMEDPLTGLPNRRAFIKRADIELRRAVREGTQTVIVLSDLDKFKSVNDTYGHKVGDQVLQQYAQIIQDTLRPGDFVARIGGEEFAIILPKTDQEQGYKIIDRLRARVEATPCPYVDEHGENQNLKYTGSFGLVAVASGAGHKIDDLLSIADTGLYQAKEQGRNKVITVPPVMPTVVQGA